MDALGLRFSLRAAGSGAVQLNTSCVPQNVGKCGKSNSALGTTLRKRYGFTRRIREIGSTEMKRSRKRVFAAQAAAQSSASELENNYRHGSNQAVVDKPEEQRGSETEGFNWNTAWYPVAAIHDLDKDGPTAATLVGRPLAIWWDRSSDKWQVYADQCPHRLAPLSEGSISAEGHLRCSYHGWTFKGDSGQCTGIPQAPKNGKQLHESKNACVPVYPSMEQQGILWLWPDLSQGPINMEAAANPPPHFPELSDPSFGFDISSRDLEYGYEALIENLMDPSHAHFAHHKILAKREAAKPLNLKLTTKVTPAGFSGEDERSHANFYAPCCFKVVYNIGGKEKSDNPGSTELDSKRRLLIFMCVPISPGRSRLIWSFPQNYSVALAKAIPRWVFHTINNLVTDSDMILLHVLERNLEHEGASNWFKRCYTPAGADTYVRGFRKWLNDFAGGAPDWGGRFENRFPPSPTKEVMLDRYHSHVVKCKSCSSALRNFKALQVGLQVLAIALVGLVAASAVVPIRPVANRAVPLVIGAVLSTILSQWLEHFIYKTFYFHDYNHAAVKD